MSNFDTVARMTIANIEEDNRRLKSQIDSGAFQPGYVANCKNYIASNYRRITELKSKMGKPAQ